MRKFQIILTIIVGAACLAIEASLVAGLVYALNIDPPYVVVIDAGHGGRDNGVSSDFLHEADINLEISRYIRDELQSRGIIVVMTRDDEHSLADGDEPNKKRADMKRRHDIIERAKPDLAISIHVNSFPRIPSVHGIQTFFHGESGQPFAEFIQKHINQTDLCDKDRIAMKGDYFILETAYPSVLIECGFLSNPSDHAKLSNIEYKQTLAKHLADSIMESLKSTTPIQRLTKWYNLG
ncbi:MAG: N-acetylmuramoyl-L-alanine amidase [Firmicutes bacterium]|nr:N-acetylmuramoyl-L-alanine amidase [Bacillota bacterium]